MNRAQVILFVLQVILTITTVVLLWPVAEQLNKDLNPKKVNHEFYTESGVHFRTVTAPSTTNFIGPYSYYEPETQNPILKRSFFHVQKVTDSSIIYVPDTVLEVVN